MEEWYSPPFFIIVLIKSLLSYSGAFNNIFYRKNKDEANLSVSLGFLSVIDLLKIIDSKPKAADLIIKRRNAHPQVMAAADLVTEMRAVKHYYRLCIPGRIGIEK